MATVDSVEAGVKFDVEMMVHCVMTVEAKDSYEAAQRAQKELGFDANTSAEIPQVLSVKPTYGKRR